MGTCKLKLCFLEDIILIKKQVRTIVFNSFDLFFCLYEVAIIRCRSPPIPFNLKIFELNGGIKVNDNATCFIKIAKGIYEEITYKELQERRKIIETYKDKLFIPVQRNATRSRKRGI